MQLFSRVLFGLGISIGAGNAQLQDNIILANCDGSNKLSCPSNYFPTDEYVCMEQNPAKVPHYTPVNLTVALFADVGFDSNAQNVLWRISKLKPDLVLCAGDFGYNSAAGANMEWVNLIRMYLGSTPFIPVVGNHDNGEAPPGWGLTESHEMTYELVRRLGSCEGHTGVNYVCTFKGITVVSVAPGVYGNQHDIQIREMFEKYPAKWRICQFHKNMEFMNVGSKRDEAGWPAYEECRRYGALILTGHEHSYARTHELTSFKTQTVSNYFSSADKPVTLRQENLGAGIQGSSLLIINGAGGADTRPYLNNKEKHPWWAASASKTTGLTGGVALCKLNYNGETDKARCEYITSGGQVIDSWYVRTSLPEPVPVNNQTPWTGSGEVRHFYSIQLSSSRDDIQETNDAIDCYAQGYLLGNGYTGLRFRGVPIAREDAGKIISARIEFTIAQTTGGQNSQPASFLLQVETTGKSPELCGSDSLTQRSFSKAVPWYDVNAWDGRDENYFPTGQVETPDLAVIVRELVASDRWDYGDSMSFVVSGTGGRGVYAYDGSRCSAPRLIIETVDEPFCKYIPDPSNGSVDVTNNYKVPSTATFTCNSGYTLSGSSRLSCQANGEWSGDIPKCEVSAGNIQCAALTPPANGGVTFTNNGVYPSQAIFTCDLGYTLSSKSPLACDASGAWTGDKPTCGGVDCLNLKSPSSGSIQISNSGKYPSTATYSCNAGFVLDNNLKNTRECLPDQTWSGDEYACYPKTECKDLVAPTGGTVQTDNENMFPSTATYFCEPGMELSDDQTRECLPNSGEWSGTAPTCVGITCESITNPAPEKLYIATSNNGQYPSTVALQCKAGYVVANPGLPISGVCGPTGKWDWSGGDPSRFASYCVDESGGGGGGGGGGTDTGGFNWGDGCSAGKGETSVTGTQSQETAVGTMQKGKWGVKIFLTSNADFDITLIDTEDTSIYPEGQYVIGACIAPGCTNLGILLDAGEETKEYKGMKITYSGYSGDGSKAGNEYVLIQGEVTTTLKMSVYAFESGSGTFEYEWEYSQTPCCQATAPCRGEFEVFVPERENVRIGVIPRGKNKLKVSLQSEEDVDVALYDASDTSKYAEGQALIAFCVGDCNSGYPQVTRTDGGTLEYWSNIITYTGFGGTLVNGIQKRGYEDIEVAGYTNRQYAIEAFGFAASNAKIVYEYYEPPPPGGSGFDWGTGCGAGEGSFDLDLKNIFQHEVVGTIPSGLNGVSVKLESVVDVDITLYDREVTDPYFRGLAIVSWCDQTTDKGVCNEGLLKGAKPETKEYRNMMVYYSGFQGDQTPGGEGNEEIRVTGTTSTAMEMRAYPFETGAAKVTYSWQPSTSACCLKTGPCGGSFESFIRRLETTDIGEIPLGKVNLTVSLSSAFDIDLQLFDAGDTSKFSEGQAIIAFNTCKEGDSTCNKALLGNSPTEECAPYKGLTYCYSGFQGVADPVTGETRKGHEFVKVIGITSTKLALKGFGYRAGKAFVEYVYYEQ